MITTRPVLAAVRGERPKLAYLGVSARRSRDSSLWHRFGLIASIYRHRYVTELMSLFLARGQ
jgi:hypothetical protein